MTHLLILLLVAAPLHGGAAIVVSGPDPGFCHPAGFETAPHATLADAARQLAEGRREPDRGTRIARFTAVMETAEERIAEAPDDLEARWWRIAAMGLLVDDEGARRKVQLAGAIRDEAETILAADPDHPGAHHALGRLHSGVLRLNPVLRFLALRLFGEGDLGQASWEEAEAHLRQARDAVPCALIHRWELSRSYAYQGRSAEALRELDTLLSLPDRAPQDPEIRERAEALRDAVQRRR